jgi:hypothetical protein
LWYAIWSIDPADTLGVAQLVKEFLAIPVTVKFITVFATTYHWSLYWAI